MSVFFLAGNERERDGNRGKWFQKQRRQRRRGRKNSILPFLQQIGAGFVQPHGSQHRRLSTWRHQYERYPLAEDTSPLADKNEQKNKGQ